MPRRALAVLIATLAAVHPAWAEPDWEATLERVSPAVVSLHVTAARDFDTEDASTSQGTGFVVDADAGLILTNRHMVHAGPVVATAVFLDNEEVPLEPVYRDPVHDFGIYRFDPADVRFADVGELELAPDAARVGLEIRVVGNDAGEKLSFLDGTLARLDRNAPHYGGNTYNDFNTFYFQAASNTSGGSSGSPVIDGDGRVVALNAGGSTQAASSFYLPLHRVVRALDLVRAGAEVPRGTLQTTFVLEPFQDLRRLGLDTETEAVARTTSRFGGLLTVHSVVPGGPADGVLQQGDIVLGVDGVRVADFAALEALIDARVGGTVELEIQRLSDRRTVTLDVQDLHGITPDRYLEMGRAVLHDVSYQQARNHHVPVGGVYVATPGNMFAEGGVRSGDVLLAIDGQPVADLAEATEALASAPSGARIRVRHAPIAAMHQVREAVVAVDRTWFSMRTCVRDAAGAWPCVDAPAASQAAEAGQGASVALPASGDRRARAVASALVRVDFHVPYSTAGVAGDDFVGTGVIVDAARGIVLADRDTVPVALGDLTLTFGGAVRVPAEVVWLHPVHDVAVLRFDPAAVGALEVGEVAFVDRPLEEGRPVRIVALDADGRVVVDQVEVERVDALVIPPSRTPRYREFHAEVARLATVRRSVGGVAVDRKGRALGLWASFYFPRDRDRGMYVLPTAALAEVLDAVDAGTTPVWRDIRAEMVPIPLADARDRGMPDPWVRRLLERDDERLEALEVVRIAGDGPSAGVLRQADILLAIDGVPATSMDDLRALGRDAEHVLMVLRDAEVHEVRIRPVEVSGAGVRRVVAWHGMLVHAPHAEVSLQTQLAAPREGAYIAWYWYGSPAARGGVRPTQRILEVQGQPTPDLDRFVEVVASLPGDAPVVVKVQDLEGIDRVRTLDPMPAFWPLEVLDHTEAGWSREAIPTEDAPATPPR